jgi:hypothetical protein
MRSSVRSPLTFEEGLPGSTAWDETETDRMPGDRKRRPAAGGGEEPSP